MRAWVVLISLIAGCSAPVRPDPTPSIVPTEPTAVYYAKDGRLVREFHELPEWDGSAAARVRSAVTEMLRADSARDPDYAGLWPEGARVDAVSMQGETVSIDIGNASDHDASADIARLAVQQLVWTATAVPGVTVVNLTLQRRRDVPMWGHVDLSAPQRRAPAVDVLAPVWLISPQHGDQVGREVTLHLAGIVFEATVSYAVRRGGTVVRQGFVTVNQGPPAQGDAKEVITLEPGEYVIEAFAVSAGSGEPTFLDDHTVTVV